MVDQHKKSVVDAEAEDDDEEDDLGGISISQARERMMKEDQLDRELYREKIKRKHKVREGRSVSRAVK